MRMLARIALAALGLVVAALIALVLLLPSWVESAGFRDEFERYVYENLGRTISYGAADVRFFPPRVEVADLAIGGRDVGAQPVIQAERAALQLAWRALLSARAVVDELVIDGATLRVVRTVDGIDLLAAAVPAAPAVSTSDSGVPVALESITLRRSTIVFDDRAVAPPVVWELSNVELHAEPSEESEAAGPIEFTLQGDLGSAGVEANGRAALDGAIAVDLAIRGLDTAPLRSYASVVTAISGNVDATARLERTEPGAAFQFNISLDSQQLKLSIGELSSSGPTSVTTTLSLDGDMLSGPLSVELGEAELVYGAGALHKPAGMPASLAGKLTRRGDTGLQVDYTLKLYNADARGLIRTEPRLSVAIDAPAFDLAGWDAILPALADAAPSGKLSLEGVVYRSTPNRLTGGLALAGVSIERDGVPPLVLDGFLDATGDALVPRELFATTGAAKFSVEGEISGLFDKDGRGRSLALNLVTAAPVESNAVFSLVEAMRDAVFGALVLDASIVLPLTGAADLQPATERLRGDVHFQIGGDEVGGRLRGVSLLRSVFGRFGALGHAALLALPMKRGKPIEDYYSEDFQVAKATFHIENGEARTQDFIVVHDSYTTRLYGGVRLADLALDMRGEVLIGEELDAALAGTEGGTARVIPISRVGGTVLDPTVSLKREDVAAFTARYTLGENSKLGKKIDKALGDGASKLLRGVLDAAGGKK